MKKTVTIIIIILGVNINLFAQAYQPFPEDKGTWVMYKSADQGSSWTKYETNGDTTIGSFTYIKVNSKINTGFPHSIYYDSIANATAYVLDYGPSKYSFAYRNDSSNKKVYIFENINGIYKETLWYDFNLKVGDTLKNMYALNDYPVEIRIVESIDSILICGTYHKRYTCQVNCGGNHVLNEVHLIEGIGFEDNFISTDRYCIVGEKRPSYSTSFFCTTSSIEELQNSVQQLQLFPNPTSDLLQINFNSPNITFPFNYTVIDCLGNEVIKEISSNNNIDVAKLSAGIYFLKLGDKNNNLFHGKFMKQ